MFDIFENKNEGPDPVLIQRLMEAYIGAQANVLIVFGDGKMLLTAPDHDGRHIAVKHLNDGDVRDTDVDMLADLPVIPFPYGEEPLTVDTAKRRY